MTEDERAQLRGQILTEPPATMQNKVGADLDGRLELVGYDLDAEKDARGRILPGRKLTVTWYWRCKVPLHEGWKLFTHVTDDTGTNRVRGDEAGLIRQHYPPSLWREGEVVADRQELDIPADFNSKMITFFVGAWFGPHRLPIRNDVPNDDGRVRIGPFPMKYDLPETTVPQINSSITPDGRLDEPEWSVAVVLDPFVLAPDGAPSDRVRARLLWNSRYLYAAFEIRDPMIVARLTRRDDAIYDEDAVQVLLDEDGDGKDYYDLAVSPTGVVYDCLLDEPGKGDAKAFNATDFRAGVVLDGAANDADPDQGYTIELQIPFHALAKFKERTPRVGQTWRANFYVLDMPALPPQGGPTPRQEGFAWSAPQVTNFHVPRRFGDLTFGDLVAVPPPAPVPPQPVAPPPPVESAAGVEGAVTVEPPAPSEAAPVPIAASAAPTAPAPAPAPQP